MKIEQRIKELRLELVTLSKSHGTYVPAVAFGKCIITSGQLPFSDNRLIFPGRVGKEVSLDNAGRAAKIALVNCLSAIKSVCGDLDKIKKIIRLNGFVSSALDFNDQHKVLNSASDLLIEIFGLEKGQHTRTAIGVLELPMGSCVELDLLVEI